MPSPLTQNRGQLLARQALLNASATPSIQTRQIKQTEASSALLSKDQQTEVRQQDRLVLQNQQATDAQIRQTITTRNVNNESQANKVVASRKDAEAYLLTQAQRKLMSAPMNLGYA